MTDPIKTPSGARITLTEADGTEHDVTEHVGAIYDLLASSMDWGSDFLTIDDALGFVGLVDLAGYADPEDKGAARQRARDWLDGKRGTTPENRPDMIRYYEGLLECMSLLERARAQLAAADRGN